MYTQQKAIKNKIALLKLAEMLGSVSQACKVMGCSRDSFYRVRKMYETGGELALKEVNRRKPIMKNRVEAAVESAIVALAIDKPALGQIRVSNELKRHGLFVSPGGVRCVWLRNDLETFGKRLVALKAKAAQEGLALTEYQLCALERTKEETEAHGEIETIHPGYLGTLDTYYVGSIKAVGRVYQQTFIDTYSKVAIAKLYDGQHAFVAADLLTDRVLPFLERNNVALQHVRTDRGAEYRGVRELREYQLNLDTEGVDHSRAKGRHRQSDGICERFHRTLQDDFYSTAFRKTLYSSLEQLQTDLDRWMDEYNRDRPHFGKYCFGKTPMQTFLDSRQLAWNNASNIEGPVAGAPAF